MSSLGQVRNSLEKYCSRLPAISSQDSDVNHDSGDTGFSALRAPMPAIAGRPIRIKRGSSATSIEWAMVV